MSPIEEPLVESAPLSWQLAGQFCRGDPETGETCAWNHGLWQFLRLMGLAGSAARRGAFYKNAIGTALSGIRSPRVLVSGATDYAMLALVAAALEDRLGTAAVTLVDVCETPLRLGQWYAGRAGMRLDVVQSDMLDYDPRAPFDLVCTDSFISRFPHRQWPELAAKWNAALRSGGSVATATRLRPRATADCIRFSDGEVEAFRGTVLRLAEEARGRFAIAPAELAARAERYARHQFNYPVRSREEVRALFEGAGFALRMELLPADTGNPAGIAVPTVPHRGEFLGIVACRD
jgi:hypothetical protein